jgi:hypothetical protein
MVHKSLDTGENTLKANHIPCRSHDVTLPCRAAKGLELCLSRLIYTVKPSLIHTCHAAPVPCPEHAVLKATSQGIWATCLRSASSGYHAEIHVGYQKHANPLQCRTSSSDISAYHTDFHEGHGTGGGRQGSGMACMN